jgi:hypothetical protein
MDELNQWAEDNGIVLFKDMVNPNSSFFYISKGNETLQIVLEDNGNSVVVDIWSVETYDDQEFHYKEIFDASKTIEETDRLVQRARQWFSTRKL